MSAAQEHVILDAILHAAVASLRDAPIEDQFEVAEGILCEEVFGDLGVGVRLQTAVLQRPGIAGGIFLARIVPPAHVVSVEEQLPSVRFLGGRELVLLRGERAGQYKAAAITSVMMAIRSTGFHGNCLPSRRSTRANPQNTPTKYSAHMGMANSIRLKTSGVGVMMAAAMTMPRMA